MQRADTDEESNDTEVEERGAQLILQFRRRMNNAQKLEMTGYLIDNPTLDRLTDPQAEVMARGILRHILWAPGNYYVPRLYYSDVNSEWWKNKAPPDDVAWSKNNVLASREFLDYVVTHYPNILAAPIVEEPRIGLLYSAVDVGRIPKVRPPQPTFYLKRATFVKREKQKKEKRRKKAKRKQSSPVQNIGYEVLGTNRGGKPNYLSKKGAEKKIAPHESNMFAQQVPRETKEDDRDPDWILHWMPMADFGHPKLNPRDVVWQDQLFFTFGLFTQSIVNRKAIIMGCVSCFNRSVYVVLLYLLFVGVPYEIAFNTLRERYLNYAQDPGLLKTTYLGIRQSGCNVEGITDRTRFQDEGDDILNEVKTTAQFLFDEYRGPRMRNLNQGGRRLRKRKTLGAKCIGCHATMLRYICKHCRKNGYCSARCFKKTPCPCKHSPSHDM